MSNRLLREPRFRGIQIRFLASGKAIAVVSLGRSKTNKAYIYYEDHQSLLALGLSPNWSCTKLGNPLAWNSIDGKPLGVARVLLNAGPSEAVRYADHDPTNLLRSNLYLVDDRRAKGHDRSRIRRANRYDPDTYQLNEEIRYQDIQRIKDQYKIEIDVKELIDKQNQSDLERIQ